MRENYDIDGMQTMKEAVKQQVDYCSDPKSLDFVHRYLRNKNNNKIIF